ncbi:MAG: porin family protein [Bacteroidota bacterium]
MQRILLITLAGLLSATALSAQFGLRAGYNFANASVDFDNLDISTGDSEGQFMAGIFYNIPIGTKVISIQPEINYMGRGYTYTIEDFAVPEDFEASFAYLDAGGLVKINIGADNPVGFYVGAGPFFSFVLSGTLNDEDIDFDTEQIRRNELLLAGAAGLTFGPFFVEARYYGSLSDQTEQDISEIRQRSLGLNAGICF